MKLTYATTPAKTSNPTKNPFAAAMKKSRRRYPFIIITNTATVHASFYKDSKTDSLQFTLQQQTKMKKKKKTKQPNLKRRSDFEDAHDMFIRNHSQKRNNSERNLHRLKNVKPFV